MTLYSVYALDRTSDGAEIRAANRPDHVVWLKSLGETLRMAGPLLGEDGESMIGSLLLLSCSSRAELDQLLAQDPYEKAGLFERVEVRPYKWLLGADLPPAT